MRISKDTYEVIKKYEKFIHTTVTNGTIPRYAEEKHMALNSLGAIYKELWDKSYQYQSCSSCVFNMLKWCWKELKEYESLMALHTEQKEVTIKGKVLKNKRN